MSNVWARGSSAEWRRTREEVMEAYRDPLTGVVKCQIAHQDICTGVATSVHHTRSRRIHGDDKRWLLPACQACNNREGSPESGDPEPTPGTQW